MDGFTAGWRRIPVDGGLLLVAPDPARGVVRVRTGIPLRPIKQVVDAMVSGGPAFEARALPRTFSTAEGEHAAIFEYAAHAGSMHMRRTIVVIAGDTSLVTLDGRITAAEAPPLTANLEGMATSFSMGLGSDRWRPFHYQPPKGWHRRARFHADLWLPPDLPANSGELTVFHSRPMDPVTPAGQHARLFEHVSSEFAKGAPLERHGLKLPNGLEGEFVTFEGLVEGEVRRVTTVALGHARRHYLFRLDTGPNQAAANLDALRLLVMSAHPVPGAKQPVADLSPWSE